MRKVEVKYGPQELGAEVRLKKERPKKHWEGNMSLCLWNKINTLDQKALTQSSPCAGFEIQHLQNP